MRPSRAAREVRLRYASGFYRQSAALLIQTWKAPEHSRFFLSCAKNRMWWRMPPPVTVTAQVCTGPLYFSESHTDLTVGLSIGGAVAAAARSPPVKMVKGQALGPAQEGFPGTYPIELLESLQPGLDVGMAREDYPAWWMSEARKQSEARGCLSELEELLSTGRSYGRGTEWAVMDIQPWAAFTLHAHGVSALHRCVMPGAASAGR